MEKCLGVILAKFLGSKSGRLSSRSTVTYHPARVMASLAQDFRDANGNRVTSETMKTGIENLTCHCQ